MQTVQLSKFSLRKLKSIRKEVRKKQRSPIMFKDFLEQINLAIKQKQFRELPKQDNSDYGKLSKLINFMAGVKQKR